MQKDAATYCCNAMCKQHLMSIIGRAVIAIHVMSIDIALGVAGSMVLSAHVLNASIGWQWYVVVPLATWTVYIVDRLIDVRRTSAAVSTYRHSMVRTYRRPLTMLATVLFITACLLALATPSMLSMWPLGFLATTAVFVHLGLQRVRYSRVVGLLKDGNVIIAYTLGTVGLPMLHAPLPFNGWPVAAVIALATTAIVVVESAADLRTDIAANSASIARSLPPYATMASVVVAATGLLLLAQLTHPIVYIQALGTAALPIVFRSSAVLPIKRAYAESILAIPLLLLI